MANSFFYRAIHAQHDEGDEEEERPDLGSGQGRDRLRVDLEHEAGP